jgi:hypothetical protein
MSISMKVACYNGDTPDINLLVAAGESPNSVTVGGSTPAMGCLIAGHLDSFLALVDRGADILKRTNKGANLLHFAAMGGDISCIKWVLAHTPFTATTYPVLVGPPLVWALRGGHYEASNLLVEKGGNIFQKVDGIRAIDVRATEDPTVTVGPQVLLYAKTLKWESAKHLLLLSASLQTIEILISQLAFNDDEEDAVAVQSHSLRLASRVLANTDLIRVIASFLIPNIFTRDKSVQVPDAVRERVEAELAAAVVRF